MEDEARMEAIRRALAKAARLENGEPAEPKEDK